MQKIGPNITVPLEHYEGSKLKSPEQCFISEMPEQQKSKLEEIIKKYPEVFSEDPYDIGKITTEKMKLNMMCNSPITKRPYKCTREEQLIIDKQK